MSRLIPHPPNFAPISGIALFGAAYYSRQYLAFIIPIIAMWVSDLALNNVIYRQYFDGFVWFYNGSIFTYCAFALIVTLGMFTLKKVRIPNLLASILSASVIFFTISNFGVWLSGTIYPKDFNGLMTCYTAAIPFFKNTIAGDIIYSTVMFGAFELSVRRFPILNPQKITAQNPSKNKYHFTK
jgi:hypothetical protein